MQLSPEKFAKRLGVGWRSVYRWENGDAKPSNMAKQRLHELAHEHANGQPDPSTPRRIRAEVPDRELASGPTSITPFSGDTTHG